MLQRKMTLREKNLFKFIDAIQPLSGETAKNVENDPDYTIEHQAEVENNSQQTLSLVQKAIRSAAQNPVSDINLNIQNDKDGSTLLACAVFHNHRNIAQELIEAKVNPDIQDHKGNTALHWAVPKGDLEFVKKLILEAKANPNLPGGRLVLTPLMIAAQYDCSEIANFLMTEAKVNVDARDSEGASALFYAIYSDNKKMVTALINGNISLDIKNNLLLSPLDIAIDRSNIPIISIFLNLGMLPHPTNRQSLCDLINKAPEDDVDALSCVEVIREKTRQAEWPRSMDRIDKATHGIFPTTLLRIVAEYDVTITLNKFGLFKPENIAGLVERVMRPAQP